VVVDEAELDPVAAELARNDAIFREANERIAATAEELGLADGGLLPFICECADVSCTVIVQLSAAEYRAVRKQPTQFLYTRGHEATCLGWCRVLDEFERYTVIEKIGDAAEVATALDPRAEAT
jgi:hypothetical protein